jgi:hypothetical protein
MKTIVALSALLLSAGLAHAIDIQCKPNIWYCGSVLLTLQSDSTSAWCTHTYIIYSNEAL